MGGAPAAWEVLLLNRRSRTRTTHTHCSGCCSTGHQSALRTSLPRFDLVDLVVVLADLEVVLAALALLGPQQEPRRHAADSHTDASPEATWTAAAAARPAALDPDRPVDGGVLGLARVDL